MTQPMNADDLRAAVAAGMIDEAQAAGIISLSHERHGQRAGLPSEDEPFELFRGFNEIFITVGIVLLFAGLGGIASLIAEGIFIPLLAMGLSWGFAEYFTRRRRMVLPSVVLAALFAIASVFFAGFFVGTDALDRDRWVAFGVLVLGGLMLLGFYWRFRVPIALFFVGIIVFLATLTATGYFSDSLLSNIDSPETLFDLGQSARFAIVSLGVGIAAFLTAMAFDIRDPHRISRLSSCGFWLHLIAAPLIVNTIGLTLYNIGGPVGYGLTAGALVLVSVVALAIDRRSFLTAGIIYMAFLISLALDGVNSGWSTTLTLLALGIFITILGAGWTRLRAALMRGLPDFPMKGRLPPYAIG